MKAVKISEHEVRVGRAFFLNDDWKAICDSADCIVTDIVMGGCACGCDWKVCSLEEYINDESKSHFEGLINDFGYSEKNIGCWVHIAEQVYECLNKRDKFDKIHRGNV